VSTHSIMSPNTNDTFQHLTLPQPTARWCRCEKWAQRPAQKFYPSTCYIKLCQTGR